MAPALWLVAVAWTAPIVLAASLLLPAQPARACGGMTQVDPPSLQLDPGPADTSLGLPPHDCRIRLVGATTFPARAGESCGAGMRGDSVVDELQGIVVLADDEPFPGFTFFAPNPATTAQLNDPRDPLAPPQARGQRWQAATGATTERLTGGARIDLLFLVSTPARCTAVLDALATGNAIALGATNAAGLFDDPAHFDVVENVPVLSPLPALGPFGPLLLPTVLIAVLAAYRRRGPAVSPASTVPPIRS